MTQKTKVCEAGYGWRCGFGRGGRRLASRAGQGRAAEAAEAFGVEVLDLDCAGAVAARLGDGYGADADRVLPAGVVVEGVAGPVPEAEGLRVGTEQQHQLVAAADDPGRAVVGVGVGAEEGAR